MAGKNTAAFGIYPNKMALEEGLVTLKQANFRHEDAASVTRRERIVLLLLF